MDLGVRELINVENTSGKYDGKIISQADLYDIFPFKKTKMQQLIKSGELPLVKIGKDYGLSLFHVGKLRFSHLF